MEKLISSKWSEEWPKLRAAWAEQVLPRFRVGLRPSWKWLELPKAAMNAITESFRAAPYISAHVVVVGAIIREIVRYV